MKGGVRLWCETLVQLWCETLHQRWRRVCGGSRSTKPYIFPCKVVAAGDERVPRVCGGCGWGRLPDAVWVASSVTVAASCFGCACACVVTMRVLESVVADRSGMAGWLLSSDVVTCVEMCRFATRDAAKRIVMAAWMLHGALSALVWGGSRSTKPCIFLCKVVAAGDERYLVCAAVAAGVGFRTLLGCLLCNGGCKLLWLCLVRA